MDTLILLIEDNDDLRQDIAELLTLDGYSVITADRGLKGLQLAKEKLPDLIICDIVMPGLNGYQVFSALRKNWKTRCIPFFFSTARSENSDRKKAKALGVKNYLVKPFDEREILRCIRESLRLNRDTLNGSLTMPSTV